MICYAPAKINLSLDIIKKREDGFHELEMIMQTVSLFDKITIEKDDKISLNCNKPNIPTDERNLVWKAAKNFFEYTNLKGGCNINLEKIIPDGAGLGGGSSDAAEVLLALNKIYDTRLTNDELCKISVSLGADVPFFILKGTCLAKGIGEKLTPIENNTNPFILIYKPDFSISTKWAYENLNLSNKPKYNIEKIVENLKNQNYKFDNMFNYLEDVSTGKFAEINDIKTKFKKLGATGTLMSGSGSSVFAVFDDEITAKRAMKAFEKNKIFLVKFI